jgi:hypothetical protein
MASRSLQQLRGDYELNKYHALLQQPPAPPAPAPAVTYALPRGSVLRDELGAHLELAAARLGSPCHVPARANPRG